MSVYRVGTNKSSINNFPSVRPSLNLDFANTKALDPRITFTRSTGGSYVGADGLIKYAGVNEARFDHDPVTGESLGLLIEESRTNLYLQSENFSTTWSPTGLLAFGSGSTANAIAAPDNQITADLLVENTAASNHMVSQSINVTTGTVYTVSAFVKAAPTTRKVQLLVSNTNFGVTPSAIFDLATGTLTGNNHSTAIITPFPNGWYRVTMTTIAATSTGANSASIRLVNASNANSYTGDGTSGIYLWGAQLEVGAFPTSYIPTQASSRTRAADNASITGRNFSSWYNQSEGSVFTSYQQNSNTTGLNFGVFSLTSSTANSNNLIDYFIGSGLSPVFRIAFNGVTNQVYENGGTSTANVRNKGAFSFTTNKFTKCINGTFYLTSLIKPITGGIQIPTVNTLVLGQYWGGLTQLNGTIRRLTYWPKRLPNAQLQALTR